MFGTYRIGAEIQLPRGSDCNNPGVLLALREDVAGKALCAAADVIERIVFRDHPAPAVRAKDDVHAGAPGDQGR